MLLLILHVLKIFRRKHEYWDLIINLSLIIINTNPCCKWLQRYIFWLMHIHGYSMKRTKKSKTYKKGKYLFGVALNS